MASDEIKLMLFAGELSTQDNLKHLHPELVAQIVKQVWPVAYTQGRADAWKSLDMKYHLVDFAYYCKLQEQQHHRQETATKYAEEYMAEIKLPGGEND